MLKDILKHTTIGTLICEFVVGSFLMVAMIAAPGLINLIFGV